LSLRGFLRILGAYRLYERWLKGQVKKQDMPQHVAVILDGNRRWANERSLPYLNGHLYGAKIAEDFLKWCLDLGIRTITVYVFSTENFRRPKEEVERILQLIGDEARRLRNDERLHKNKVRVKTIGRIDLLPESLRQMLRDVERETENYDEHYLNIAIAYGGRAEIVDAARKIVEDVAEQKVSLNQIDEDLFSNYLYTSHLPNPYPDLIVRTSGEERLSGFLLWQSAYSELCFLDVYWPDFRKIDLLRAVRTYQQRKRRYGR